MYVYQAIKRPKENIDMSGPKVLREVLYDGDDEAVVITHLKDKVARYSGTWRIYRSVNKRDPKKAKLELIETLIKQLVVPASVSTKSPESLWKDILMQPHNKAERLFLIDFDSLDKNLLEQKILSNPNIPIKSISQTPNGFAIVCEPFDPKLIANIPEISIKKDALLFIETFEVP